MGYSGRLIEMKHRGPGRLVHILPCRVGPPFESGVVVNVPASLHGTVMPLACEPIHLLRSSGPWTRGQQRSCSGARNANLSVGQQPFEKDASLGIGAKHPSLTSRRYRALLWERLAAAAFQCYRGARKRSRSEQGNTHHLLWG
ncbi:hypothetical protein BKA66DRAFT_292337 [Pyrenochaeta sp. MPI-SDFR-AT-0127]|nr:hypothetical protein BKA66DRAFT_292337 [Pyrenochaeta sp. MPI-SDFR-AT-0127]